MEKQSLAEKLSECSVNWQNLKRSFIVLRQVEITMKKPRTSVSLFLSQQNQTHNLPKKIYNELRLALIRLDTEIEAGKDDSFVGKILSGYNGKTDPEKYLSKFPVTRPLQKKLLIYLWPPFR